MPAVSDETLYNALKELDIVSEQVLSSVYTNSQKTHTPLSDLLLDRNIVSEENLAKLRADLYSIPYISLSDVLIPDSILQIIPEVVAKKNHCIAFKKDVSGLHVATSDPDNTEILDLLRKKVGCPVVVYLASRRDILNAFSHYSKEVVKAFEDLIAENEASAQKALGKEVELPIIKIVDSILQYAYQNKASDVHIEPEGQFSLVRFRIDGILHDIIKLHYQIHSQIVTRIKVLSKLRTDEHLAPQDGKITFKTDTDTVDIRVSIVPILEGEKIVMRLMSASVRQFSLSDLGLSVPDLTKVKAGYDKPYGMILATGPTGSGKTTTMYAILKLLNSRDVNIMTIEDPVEYDLEGVNQIQVNAKTNLTFASGLRSILRQDPNIILVGEIRDEETASIATNAAMTGHLVLSTLHTNDAATSIPRLLDMNIEPFLVSSTLSLIVAQRLVREIHSACRVSEEINSSELTKHIGSSLITTLFGDTKKLRFYKGKGCAICHDTGYVGRIGIFEVLVMDEEIREAIVDRKDASVIAKIAVKNGMRTMIEDGLEKVKSGLTTFDEVIRVTKE